jgi:hypothetical protein
MIGESFLNFPKRLQTKKGLIVDQNYTKLLPSQKSIRDFHVMGALRSAEWILSIGELQLDGHTAGINEWSVTSLYLGHFDS